MTDDTVIKITVTKYKDGFVTAGSELININQWQRETSRGALAESVISSLLRRTGWRESELQ